MKLVGITGLAGAGKDTVADILVNDFGLQKTAFAKPIKDGCKVMFGLTDEQLYGDLKEVVVERYGCTPREILQWAGTEFGRDLVHPDVWLIQVEQQWNDLQALDPVEHTCGGLVVADVRFENEAALIRRLGGTVLHVQRPLDALMTREEYRQHSSEGGLSQRLVDYHLNNNGSIERLRGMVHAVWNDVSKAKT